MGISRKRVFAKRGQGTPVPEEQEHLSAEPSNDLLKKRDALLKKYREQSKARSSRPHSLIKKKRKKYKHNRPDIETQQYKDFVKAVKTRDRNHCQFPGCKRHTFSMEVHHLTRWIDAPALRYMVSNAILLCRKCHAMITGKEAAYAPLFFSIVAKNTAEN